MVVGSGDGQGWLKRHVGPACQRTTATRDTPMSLLGSNDSVPVAAVIALIAIHGCDPPGAFARLRDESQRRNTKLRDVARALLVEMQTKS